MLGVDTDIKEGIASAYVSEVSKTYYKECRSAVREKRDPHDNIPIAVVNAHKKALIRPSFLLQDARRTVCTAYLSELRTLYEFTCYSINP